MKINYFFATLITAAFLFTGCDSKGIDESLIANTKENTPYLEKFVSRPSHPHTFTLSKTCCILLECHIECSSKKLLTIL